MAAPSVVQSAFPVAQTRTTRSMGALPGPSVAASDDRASGDPGTDELPSDDPGMGEPPGPGDAASAPRAPDGPASPPSLAAPPARSPHPMQTTGMDTAGIQADQDSRMTGRIARGPPRDP